MGGLYIHVPFCKQACHYCNFHFSTSLRHRDVMTDAIVQEIHRTQSYLPDSQLDSIYFGGGTPSLLSQQEINQIMVAVRHHYHWEQPIEVTLEANPDDITADRLEDWLAAGITRLSVGIQSFHDEDLTAMNRAHNAQEARQCIQLARGAGFQDFSIDLIYGSHTTTDKMWKDNISRAIDLDVDHISAYCLTVEEGTALGQMVRRGLVEALDEAKAQRQFYYLIDQLSLAGFEHYEISNFARNRRYAVHNTAYWMGRPYLGIGPSAHSFDGRHRRYNVANNAKYLKALSDGQVPYTVDQLSAADRYHDYLLTSIRTMWGVSDQLVAKQHSQFYPHYLSSAERLASMGRVVRKAGHTVLSHEAKFIADSVTLDLMVDTD